MEHLKNFQGVTYKKKWLIMKEKSFGLIVYWNNYNFPLEITFVGPFFSVWLAFGNQKEH